MSPPSKVWWLSWYDPPNGKPGKSNPAVTAWVSGYACTLTQEGGNQEIICARVEAPTEAEAWAAVDVEYPGASEAKRRFSEEKESGWWPPTDRFPREGRVP